MSETRSKKRVKKNICRLLNLQPPGVVEYKTDLQGVVAVFIFLAAGAVCKGNAVGICQYLFGLVCRQHMLDIFKGFFHRYHPGRMGNGFFVQPFVIFIDIGCQIGVHSYPHTGFTVPVSRSEIAATFCFKTAKRSSALGIGSGF